MGNNGIEMRLEDVGKKDVAGASLYREGEMETGPRALDSGSLAVRKTRPSG